VSVKRRLTSIRLDKIAGVDLPCQQHATIAIVKRAPADPTDPTLVMAKKTFDEALRTQLVSDQISEVFWRAFDKQYAVREAFREALADELAEGGDGSEATEGFTAAMRTLAETAAQLAREAGSDAGNTDLESAVEQAVEKWLKQQETSDMNITTKAALLAAVAKFNPETSPAAHVGIIQKAARDLKAEDALPAEGPLALAKADPAVANLQREIAILKLAPEAKSYFDGLDEAGQTAFIGKSAEDQAKDVAAANAEDPVVYKCADGTEVRKSAGDLAVTMAKRADRVDGELAKLRGDSIEKRAGEQYPNVAKAVAVDMLKSVETLGADTDAGKAVMKSLDLMNRGGKTFMKSLGSSEDNQPGGPDGLKKARDTFDGKVSEIAKRDSISRSAAMTKARTEHEDLFREAYPDTVEAAEAVSAED
jgi:hypothetical protein